MSLVRSTVSLIQRAFPGVGYAASRRWFNHISTYNSGRHLLFMNYGYASDQPLTLLPEDEEHRYSIQLYHHVAAAADLQGAQVLEVGSGRGGGASYICRYLGPQAVVAVDLAPNAIDFCHRHYQLPNLIFEQADAENLPYPDNTFDALLNVESSICYQNPDRFFAEVERVLRPGGHFLYADIRNEEEIDAWSAQLDALNLVKLDEEDITPNVLRALDQDHARRKQLINKHVPWLLRSTFNEFAGLQGSRFFYGAFAEGKKIYKRYLFRKP
jgi:ubiquinone/menaquinone biosynthesis C-methylase UbiE